MGLYGCARIGQDTVYLKAKIGLIYERNQVETLKTETLEDVGLSFGPGVGFRFGDRLFVEMEGIVQAEDLGVIRVVAGLGF